MRIDFKKCCLAAEEASARSKYYLFKCNKRNGYIALDRYNKQNNTYICYEEVGSAREIYYYLKGAIDAGYKIYSL